MRINPHFLIDINKNFTLPISMSQINKRKKKTPNTYL